MESWLDFLRSLVITLLYPLSRLEDNEDITSQLLSSLSEAKRIGFKSSSPSEVKTKARKVQIPQVPSVLLTAGGGGLQVSVQERQDVGVARLHGVQREAGGPVLQSVQGCVR